MNRIAPMIPQQHGLDDALVSSVIGNLTDCVKLWQTEETKREALKSQRETVANLLHARRDLMISYLGGRFGERMRLYEKYFALVDKALDAGNDETERLALESILSVYSSPATEGLESIARHYDRICAALGGEA